MLFIPGTVGDPIVKYPELAPSTDPVKYAIEADIVLVCVVWVIQTEYHYLMKF